MLKVLRVVAAISALVTALLLVVGDHPAEFVVADLVAVALLVLGAAHPRPEVAQVVLVAGFAFSAGVFTVAFVASVADSATNPTVGLAAAIAIVSLCVAAQRTLRSAPRPAEIA